MYLSARLSEAANFMAAGRSCCNATVMCWLHCRLAGILMLLTQDCSCHHNIWLILSSIFNHIGIAVAYANDWQQEIACSLPYGSCHQALLYLPAGLSPSCTKCQHTALQRYPTPGGLSATQVSIKQGSKRNTSCKPGSKTDYKFTLSLRSSKAIRLDRPVFLSILKAS